MPVLKGIEKFAKPAVSKIASKLLPKTGAQLTGGIATAAGAGVAGTVTVNRDECLNFTELVGVVAAVIERDKRIIVARHEHVKRVGKDSTHLVCD